MRTLHPTLLPLSLLILFAFSPSAGQAQILLHDDLENGVGNWSVYSYPGAPVCTPLSYVSTATDPNANHTPDGAYGFKMTRPSDRMVHDLTLPLSGSASLHLSLWYYDSMNLSYSDFEAVDLRTANNSQILGFATRGVYYSHPDLYWVRVLKVTGPDPTGGSGYRVTEIPRTLGWHHLEILQYRDSEQANVAEFYIDGHLGLRQTDVYDAELTRVVLGLGWSGNSSQTGYIDDITVQVIPEPGVMCLGLMSGLAAVLVGRKSV